VRIDDVTPRIDRTTGVDGRYSFVITSANVRGQSVRIVASMLDRRIRYIPKSATITLTGEPIRQDFDLEVAAEGQPIVPEEDPSRPGQARSTAPIPQPDTIDLSDLAGAVDLASALAGRIPSLRVSTASTLGGSTSLVFRGPRSILGQSQPLFVLDGVPLDNTVYASSAQRFGAGGFDYGSPIADLDLSTIANVRLLSGAEAAARYGSRGANGVVVVSTKSGANGLPLAVSTFFQRTTGTFGKLPEFQNEYGQGLDGAFEFFNGRGGGVNDAVDQSWGPALNGRPIIQSSYTEAGQPEVRLWNPRPNNVRNYFETGSTTTANGAVQGHAALGSFRLFATKRESRGITPRDRLSRLTGGGHVTFSPIPRFAFSASAYGGQAKRDNAPGSGFNEANPISQFTRMGRQVDTDSLRVHLRDATGRQINWIYTNRNNPYFAALLDSNYSRRYHGAGGASATFAVNSWLNATARGGIDYYRDGRLFTIASGWLGGFPFYTGTGQGNFSKGGAEGDEMSVQQTSAMLRFDAARTIANGTRWSVAAGFEQNGRKERVRSLGIDSAVHVPAAGAPDTATAPRLETWIGHSRINSAFGETSVAFANGASVNASLRNSWQAIVPGQHSATLFPAVWASADLVRAIPALRNVKAVGSLTLRAEWWRDGSDLTPYTVQTMYAGRTLTGSIAPIGSNLLTADPNLTPEITTGLSFAADLATRSRRIGVGVTLYSERTTDVILPVPDVSVGTLTARNAGEISNRGFEARLTTRFGDGEIGFGWEATAHASRNSNQVERLYGNVDALPLGPSQWGVRITARPGLPLGVVEGLRLSRDAASQSLLLARGLPIPDSAAGPQQFGVAQPSWILGVRPTLRFRWVSVSAIADGRVGGLIYSGTNLWGTFAGTLASTAFRPDSGLLIAGIDATTRTANTQHVSAQSYFHALAGAHEPFIYSASFFKLREARLNVAVPTTMYARLPFQAVSVSLIGRNLYLSAKAPNIDPESVFSSYQLPGVEMGQLPSTRSVGFQVSITP
jgi:TonB-dependent SusC/RagA subfamily outer membrane receptor